MALLQWAFAFEGSSPSSTDLSTEPRIFDRSDLDERERCRGTLRIQEDRQNDKITLKYCRSLEPTLGDVQSASCPHINETCSAIGEDAYSIRKMRDTYSLFELASEASMAKIDLLLKRVGEPGFNFDAHMSSHLENTVEVVRKLHAIAIVLDGADGINTLAAVREGKLLLQTKVQAIHVNRFQQRVRDSRWIELFALKISRPDLRIELLEALEEKFKGKESLEPLMREIEALKAKKQVPAL